MSDIQFLGFGLAALIGIGLVVGLLVLTFGAVCLHWTTIMLRFKKRSFGKAFGVNALLVFAPGLGSGGAHLLNQQLVNGATPVWPYVAGVVMMGLLGCLIPILILKHFYRQPFVRAVLAYVLAGVLQLGLGVALVLAIALVLIATGSSWRPALN